MWAKEYLRWRTEKDTKPVTRDAPMSTRYLNKKPWTYWTKFEILVNSAACCRGGNLDVGVIFPLGLMRLLSAAAEPGSCIWVKSYGHFKGVFMCAVMASHFLLLNGHVWKIGSGCQRPINLRLKPIFTHHAVLCYQLWNFWVKNEQFNTFFIPINISSNHGISN